MHKLPCAHFSPLGVDVILSRIYPLCHVISKINYNTLNSLIILLNKNHKNIHYQTPAAMFRNNLQYHGEIFNQSPRWF